MRRDLVEEARVKALNVLFDAAVIGFIATAIITIATFFIGKYTDRNPQITMIAVIVGPMTTYIAGRILCFKVYKDETT